VAVRIGFDDNRFLGRTRPVADALPVFQRNSCSAHTARSLVGLCRSFAPRWSRESTFYLNGDAGEVPRAPMPEAPPVLLQIRRPERPAANDPGRTHFEAAPTQR